MPRPTQAKSPDDKLDPVEVKVALARRRWTQAVLAKRIGHGLSTTNLAINHGYFPTVVRKIRKALSL